MKSKIFGIFIIAVLLSSFSVVAQNPERPNQRMERRGIQSRERFNPQMQRGNFFTDEQKESIKKIRTESEKEAKPLENQLRELEAHQQTLATEEKADLNEIYKNIEKMSDVKAELAKIRAKQRQDIRKLLTDEQLLSFDNSSRRGRFNPEMRGNRMERPLFQRGE